MKNATLPQTLHEMLNSQGWDFFISDKLGNDLFINDPERAERIHDAAEDGADGSTHSEHIDDQREYLDLLRIEAMRACEDDAAENSVQDWYDDLMAELDEIEEWHEKNGSLHKQP